MIRAFTRLPFFALVAAALAFGLFIQPAPAAQPLAAQAQPVELSLDYFKQRLTPLGQWLLHPLWGEVWKPDAGPDFRPYFYGYWEYTSDHGWLWVSNEPYGDIVYHYGRWLLDARYGWVWIPGYIWGPSWVVWRDSGEYIGWLAMPPGYQDFYVDYPDISAGAAVASPLPIDNSYGYATLYGRSFADNAFYSYWVFVLNSDFGRSDRRRYVIDHDRLRDLFGRSHDRTRYFHDRERDSVVDRSFDKERLESLAQRHFPERPAREFLRRRVPMLSVSRGREISQRHLAERRNPFAGQADSVGGLTGSGSRLTGRGLIGAQPGLRSRGGLSAGNGVFGPQSSSLSAGRGLSERTEPDIAQPVAPPVNPASLRRGRAPTVAGERELYRREILGRGARAGTRMPGAGVAPTRRSSGLGSNYPYTDGTSALGSNPARPGFQRGGRLQRQRLLGLGAAQNVPRVPGGVDRAGAQPGRNARTPVPAGSRVRHRSPLPSLPAIDPARPAPRPLPPAAGMARGGHPLGGFHPRPGIGLP